MVSGFCKPITHCSLEATKGINTDFATKVRAVTLFWPVDNLFLSSRNMHIGATNMFLWGTSGYLKRWSIAPRNTYGASIWWGRIFAYRSHDPLGKRHAKSRKDLKRLQKKQEQLDHFDPGPKGQTGAAATKSHGDQKSGFTTRRGL